MNRKRYQEGGRITVLCWNEGGRDATGWVAKKRIGTETVKRFRNGIEEERTNPSSTKKEKSEIDAGKRSNELLASLQRIHSEKRSTNRMLLLEG